ncbi:MAG: LemA family protein [Bacteroidales bacterium]|nr:LemA family protein [Bacteroidales bacterium]
MKKSWIIIGGLVLLGVILLLTLPASYNRLVKAEENVNTQWANVQGAYQRRADLIPNLVSTVKGYADFEQETLIKVIEQRANATKPTINVDPTKLNENSLAQFQKAQDELGSALSRLMVVVEKYPDLKANQNFLQLQAQLEGTENRINVERRTFNESVQQFNTSLRRFPTNILGGMFGFSKKPYFEAQAGSDVAPKVEF